MGIERALVQVVDENDCVVGWALQTQAVAAPVVAEPELSPQHAARHDEIEQRLAHLTSRLERLTNALEALVEVLHPSSGRGGR